MGFIEKFKEFHSNKTDAPDTFAKLEAIFLLGTAMKRNFINPLMTEIRHNFFMFIVAPTSRMRKTTSINLMNRFLHHINIDFLPHETTPESFIGTMSTYPGKSVVYVKDEFGSELSKMSRKNSYMSGFMDTLCALWNEYKFYSRTTITHGTVEVSEPYLSVFLATTDDRFDTYARNDFVMSGFLPRILMFFPDDSDRRPYKPRFYPDKSPENKKILQLEAEIADFLTTLKDIDSEIIMRFADIDYLNDVLQRLEVDGDPTLVALFNKMGDYIVKIADVLKISDMDVQDIAASTEIIVENKYIDLAFNLIKMLTSKYENVFENRIEWRNFEYSTRMVLNHVRKHQRNYYDLSLTRQDLSKASVADSDTFEKIIRSLLESGRLLTVLVTEQMDKKTGNVIEIPAIPIFITSEEFDNFNDHLKIELFGLSKSITEIQSSGIDIIDEDDAFDELNDEN